MKLIWADRLAVAVFVFGALFTALSGIGNPNEPPGTLAQIVDYRLFWAYIPLAVLLVGRLVDFLATGRLRIHGT